MVRICSIFAFHAPHILSTMSTPRFDFRQAERRQGIGGDDTNAATAKTTS